MTTETVRQEVTKIGNLTRDPELRYTAKNIALCEVDLAVNAMPGEEKPTEFYRLLIFRDLGENVAESCLTKSTRVIVSGTPEVEEYEVKDEQGNPTGEKRTRKKIFVTAIGPDLRFATVPEIVRIHRSNPKPSVDTTSF